MNDQLVVLVDKTPGHKTQSLGIAHQMEKLIPLDVITLTVPLFKGLGKLHMKRQGKKIVPTGSASECRRWVEKFGGGELLNTLDQLLVEGTGRMFLSAGSSAAPFTLALAKIYGGRSVTLMVPSTFGIELFDDAIVPFHDHVQGENVFITLGAPNSLERGALVEQAHELMREFPPVRNRAWSVLIGGEDKHYTIPAEWASVFCKNLLKRAEKEDACLYVTTSRRTAAKTEAELVNELDGHPRVSMLFLASKDRRNPIPGMMACCELAFCTVDSVSMISEAATAGIPLAILPVKKRCNVRRLGSALLRLFAFLGLYSKEKSPLNRMEQNVDQFVAQGLAQLVYVDQIPTAQLTPRSLRPRGDVEFNEARRCAYHLIKRWTGKEVSHGTFL